jgi:hypothetical protein
LPRILSTFYDEIFVQFNKCIKILRSNNASEYTQSVMNSFCADRGIIYQTSCPHTSQQNGVAEQKHRHLLDVARTLLFHMQVPKHFWGNAVLTDCHLINSMPSVVLNQESPFSVLYLERAPFSLTPRVFGCVAFVHVLDPGRDKLSPRSRKCIFFGYSRTQKDYRCYSLESHRYFVSADVTFFDSTLFFSSPGQCLSPDLISSREGEGSFPSPTFPIPLLSPPPQVPLASLPNPPLQVYQRSQDRCVISYRPDTTSSLSKVPAPSSSIPETNDLPLALQRGKRTCTQHPIAHFLSYNRVSPCLHSFACTLSFISIPSSYKQALSSSGWKHAMDEEMSALHKNQTWELTALPSGKQTVGCCLGLNYQVPP